MNDAARIEAKLGFDRVRQTVRDRCSTDYAARRTDTEEFCTDAAEISRRLHRTDEMRVVLMFEENFPTSGYIDAAGFLGPLEDSAYHIDVLCLG